MSLKIVAAEVTDDEEAGDVAVASRGPGVGSRGVVSSLVSHGMVSSSVSVRAAPDLKESPREGWGDSSARELTYEPGRKISHRGFALGTIERLLGEGAMGSVYELRRERCAAAPPRWASLNDVSVAAIKVLRRSSARFDRALATEVSICFALSRHSLVKPALGVIAASDEHPGTLVLCGYAEEGTLAELMHSSRDRWDYGGPLYVEGGRRDMAAIAAEMLLGLEHIHTRGVLHQDVKPDNVLVTAGGGCQISDFGLAAFAVRARRDPYVEGGVAHVRGLHCHVSTLGESFESH